MGRHLVIIDKAIDKAARRELKRHRKPDVDLVSVEELDDVATVTNAKKTEVQGTNSNGAFAKWDTVSLVFNGNYNDEKQHVTVIGVKLRVDVRDDRFMSGTHYDKFKATMAHLSTLATDGIYLYASNMGCIPGVQQLFKDASPQVFLSTDSTGSAEDEDWEVEWGSTKWYVLDREQRKHAKLHLFHKLDRITLSV
jgi:hypothetical protein